MRISFPGLLAGATLLVIVGATLRPVESAASAPVPCPAVLVIDSRGSGEPVAKLSPPGAHLVTVLSGLIAPEKVKWIANPYPARGGFSILAGAKLHVPGAYFNSVKSGKTWLASEIGKKRTDCPDTRLVLTGYSQGAQVTGDVLQHNGPFGNVAATVLFGDPYFNGRDPVDRGNPRFRTGVNGGLGKRPKFTERHVRSYCHSNDPVCQNTANPLDLFTWHDNYDKLGEPDEAAQTIANWLGASSGTPTLLAANSFVQGEAGDWQVMPARIIFTGDGTSVLSGYDGTNIPRGEHLNWTNWTGTQGVGTGAFWGDDCNPDCAQGAWTAYPVKLRAFRPRTGHFTRLAVHYKNIVQGQDETYSIRHVNGFWVYEPPGGGASREGYRGPALRNENLLSN